MVRSDYDLSRRAASATPSPRSSPQPSPRRRQSHGTPDSSRRPWVWSRVFRYCSNLIRSTPATLGNFASLLAGEDQEPEFDDPTVLRSGPEELLDWEENRGSRIEEIGDDEDIEGIPTLSNVPIIPPVSPTRPRDSPSPRARFQAQGQALVPRGTYVPTTRLRSAAHRAQQLPSPSRRPAPLRRRYAMLCVLDTREQEAVRRLEEEDAARRPPQGTSASGVIEVLDSDEEEDPEPVRTAEGTVDNVEDVEPSLSEGDGPADEDKDEDTNETHTYTTSHAQEQDTAVASGAEASTTVEEPSLEDADDQQESSEIEEDAEDEEDGDESTADSENESEDPEEPTAESPAAPESRPESPSSPRGTKRGRDDEDDDEEPTSKGQQEERRPRRQRRLS
ncbi:hypothetical protein BDN72DRAFT_880787 [Pluteus cervinus]|uniref:Uncharacterized protein n=1 Tax=Pluteus cervinus TaxID=181527 RepID=A0ACD3AKB2_9AGAR|nr:hypothetical protein BDN72DRAFT_880787 [Pluteus cervinus]